MVGDRPPFTAHLPPYKDISLDKLFKLHRIEYQGSSWPAICLQNITLNSGEIVKVIGRYNITLLVTQVNHIADM